MNSDSAHRLGLGKFRSPALHSTTLDLHGLSARDAVEVLDRKIQRALLAGADKVRVLYGPQEAKVQKALHGYLAASKVVKNFRADEERPGVIWVFLTAEANPPPTPAPTGFRRVLKMD